MTVVQTVPARRKAWWDKPRLYKEYETAQPDGEVKVFRYYTIGAVADATGKSVSAIRRWISAAVIPDAPYRTDAIEKTLGNAGRRLWTRQQVEAIAQLAEQNLVAGSSRRSTARFSAQVWALWQAKGW